MTSQLPSQRRRRTVTASMLAALLIAFILGRHSVAGPGAFAQESSSTAAATATREAELVQLSELRTQVASSPPALVCTPSAANMTETTPVVAPSPTVVAATQSGVPISYDENWTVTVTGVTLQSTYDRYTAEGVYAHVTFVIVNNTEDTIRFPYSDLKLRDQQGRVFLPDKEVGFDLGSNWNERVPPSLSFGRFVIFDIATDAQGPFILESTTDPTFRVLVELEVRG